MKIRVNRNKIKIKTKYKTRIINLQLKNLKKLNFKKKQIKT